MLEYSNLPTFEQQIKKLKEHYDNYLKERNYKEELQDILQQQKEDKEREMIDKIYESKSRFEEEG